MTTEPNVNNQTVESRIPNFDLGDIEKNKTMAGLAYIILLACPDSPFGRFHANQALLLFILGFGGGLILSLIPIIGWVLLPVFGLGVFVLAIMGLVNGFGGKGKELPLIGKFRLLQ